MRVLAKSLLDLVPLAIVTIIISVLASQSLDELQPKEFNRKIWS